ncbi:MAG TPA: endonuclease NucS [Fimbriimonadaceae bacterium]|nr:endonuclease NucS [Fimbriimonadaceae bacterium]
MRSYYRVMLGQGSSHAQECFDNGYIAAGFVFGIDLTNRLTDDAWKFRQEFIPIQREQFPDKSKAGAAANVGSLWRICKGFQVGDVVLCPDGRGSYRVGEITGGYAFDPDSPLPHHRPVKWLEVEIPRSAMSEALKNSTGSIGTVSDISAYRDEIEGFLGTASGPVVQVKGDPEVEDPVAFAMEKHLEAFLVANWASTPLSKDFDIFKEDGEIVGQQYPTDTGPIDILAVSKDRKRLLVVELKRGRASDVVVGQVLRYMGFIKAQVAEADQSVEGVVIALEDDPKLKYALMSVPAVTFYRYQVSFKLIPGGQP